MMQQSAFCCTPAAAAATMHSMSADPPPPDAPVPAAVGAAGAPLCALVAAGVETQPEQLGKALSLLSHLHQLPSNGLILLGGALPGCGRAEISRAQRELGGNVHAIPSCRQRQQSIEAGDDHTSAASRAVPCSKRCSRWKHQTWAAGSKVAQAQEHPLDWWACCPAPQPGRGSRRCHEVPPWHAGRHGRCAGCVCGGAR